MNIGELAKFRGGIATDTISEQTSASGVTIDSVLCKDGSVTCAASGTVITTYVKAADTQGLALVNSSGTSVVTVSDTGAVTAGPASGLTTGHLVRASCAATTPDLSVQTTTTTATTTPKYIFDIKRQNSSTSCIYFGADGNADGIIAANGAKLRFGKDVSGTFTEFGGYDTAGAWTLGPASGTTNTQHTMWQYGNGVSVVCEFKRVAADASTIKLTGSTNNIQIGHSGGQGYFEGISGKNAGSGANTVYCSTGHLLGTLATSDERLKTNIRDIGSTLLGLNTLRTARFDWKDGSGTDSIGFIAQDLQKTFPDFVYEQDDGLLAIKNINSFEVILVKAIQEQQAMIEALQAKVAALEAK